MVSVTANFATYQIVYEGTTYQFDVPLNDIGTGTLKVNDNAMYFSRWIRKSIEDNMLVSINSAVV